MPSPSPPPESKNYPQQRAAPPPVPSLLQEFAYSLSAGRTDPEAFCPTAVGGLIESCGPSGRPPPPSHSLLSLSLPPPHSTACRVTNAGACCLCGGLSVFQKDCVPPPDPPAPVRSPGADRHAVRPAFNLLSHSSRSNPPFLPLSPAPPVPHIPSSRVHKWYLGHGLRIL